MPMRVPAPLLMLLGARGARAAELVYWDNLVGNTVGVVNVEHRR